ncbi:MAG: IS66 family insertion sequence element accessory protein TnpB [Treponema sp.]|nr:IS66 family insertion sequence element accessory protein TnpB [Treponema sp.]
MKNDKGSFAEYIQSGKSQTVFAPEYGIKPNTLSAWVTKYKSAEACQVADLRKGVTGLLAIIENEMHLDALSNSVFFFCNKSHKLLKIVFWDKTGFWLAQKRLEMAT